MVVKREVLSASAPATDTTAPKPRVACEDLARILVGSLLGDPARRATLFRQWFKHPFLDDENFGGGVVSNVQYFMDTWLHVPFDLSLVIFRAERSVHKRVGGSGGSVGSGAWVRHKGCLSLMGNAAPRFTIPLTLLTPTEYKAVLMLVAQSRTCFAREANDPFGGKVDFSSFNLNGCLEAHVNRMGFILAFCQALIDEALPTQHYFLAKDILDLALQGLLVVHNSSDAAAATRQANVRALHAWVLARRI
jgi:hypothetical protein